MKFFKGSGFTKCQTIIETIVRTNRTILRLNITDFNLSQLVRRLRKTVCNNWDVIGQEVELLICYKTDLGYMAIINETHWGMLFFKNVFPDF